MIDYTNVTVFTIKLLYFIILLFSLLKNANRFQNRFSPTNYITLNINAITIYAFNCTAKTIRF